MVSIERDNYGKIDLVEIALKAYNINPEESNFISILCENVRKSFLGILYMHFLAFLTLLLVFDFMVIKFIITPLQVIVGIKLKHISNYKRQISFK